MRNVLKNYDPKYNVKQDPDEEPKDKSEPKGNVQPDTPEIVEENTNIEVVEEDPNATKRIAVELYKDKLRQYASDYKELNGLWFNLECI